MSTFDEELGKRIGWVRKRSVLSQEALAALVAESLDRPFHRVQLAKSETGTRFLKPEEISAIAKTLDVTTDALLGLEDLRLPEKVYPDS